MASINIGYVFLWLYDFFANASSNVSFGGIIAVLSNAEWILLGISGIMLVVFLYFYYMTLEYEHAGFHRREEMEVILLSKIHAEPRNDRFEQAVALANSSNTGDWRRAVLEADILLGEMLTERGFPGENVGEQLKGASHAHFSTLSLAWEAHNVRNAIAHEGETFPLDQRLALQTIDKYRRVFEEFGFI